MIQSPLIVVEVLSPSAESYDRTEKFARYMRCPTLEVSMLVSQDEQHIEVYRRSMGWKQERFSAGQTVKLEQLDLELPVGRSWNASLQRTSCYASRQQARKVVYMKACFSTRLPTSSEAT